MFIAIDFDGTIVDHAYPHIGRPVPEAIDYMKKFQDLGARLILYTMRDGKFLEDAVNYCKENGVEFYAHNTNPTQKRWTSSQKVYAHIYIDDAAFGCPKVLINTFERPCVDWRVVGPSVIHLINTR